MTNAYECHMLTLICLCSCRCVEQRDKDLALGVFNAVIALGASIPAPILFGWGIGEQF